MCYDLSFELAEVSISAHTNTGDNRISQLSANRTQNLNFRRVKFKNFKKR